MAGTYNISFHVGTSNHRHNTDASYREKLKHVDHEKTKENYILKDIYKDHWTKSQQKQVQVDFLKSIGLQDYVDEYNSTCKRASRRRTIESEMDLMVSNREGGQVHRLREHEIVVEIGTHDSHPDEREQKLILYRWYQQFERESEEKGFFITQAVIHVDEQREGNMHLHLDFFNLRDNPDAGQGLKCDYTLDGATGHNFAGWRSEQVMKLHEIGKEYNCICKDRQVESNYRKEESYWQHHR